jgi:hypothetical protein
MRRVFRAEKFYADDGMNEILKSSAWSWVKACDGRYVEPSAGRMYICVTDDGDEYGIHEDWLEEVEE